MTERDEVLASIDEKLATLELEDLGATAQLLQEFRDSIATDEPLGGWGVLGAVARAFETLERRVATTDRER